MSPAPIPHTPEPPCPLTALCALPRPNETATMESLLKHPEALIASAIAEAKKWNVTGYNVDMEAPSPVGDDALAVVAFVNKLSAALAAHGVKTSYCKPARPCPMLARGKVMGDECQRKEGLCCRYWRDVGQPAAGQAAQPDGHAHGAYGSLR